MLAQNICREAALFSLRKGSASKIEGEGEREGEGEGEGEGGGGHVSTARLSLQTSDFEAVLRTASAPASMRAHGHGREPVSFTCAVCFATARLLRVLLFVEAGVSVWGIGRSRSIARRAPHLT